MGDKDVSTRPNQVWKSVALSIAFTLVLATIWELFLEIPFFRLMGWGDAPAHHDLHPYHIVVTVSFASLGVGLFAVMFSRLLTELRIKEEGIQEAKTEHMHFATDVAHELRTPLAVMRAHLDSFEDKETARHLSEDVARMSRIVEQVMARNHVERLELSPSDVMDLSEIVGDVATYLAPLVIKEGRTIEVLNGDKPIPVNANDFAIDLALRNLVENAIRYSARGSTITLKILPEGADRDQGEGQGFVAVQVIDRGQGVPQDKRALIFKRFQRADRRGDGSGLGLSIVRRVVEAHKGTITVSDTPGGGATFTMSLQKA